MHYLRNIRISLFLCGISHRVCMSIDISSGSDFGQVKFNIQNNVTYKKNTKWSKLF